MKEYTLYIHYLLLASIVSAMVLTSCDSEELAVRQEAQTSEVPADVRQLVQHEVTVSLDGASTRVGYTASGDGLQLSWDASETLGVYIRKADGSIISAGTMTSSGEAGDRGARVFSGPVSAKNGDAEQYLYVHPATASIDYTSQSGSLGDPTHLNNYIPLVWHETTKFATIQGYAVHLHLSFNEDPGTIREVTLRTMQYVGETEIFPETFDASTMSAGSSKVSALTLSVTPEAAKKVGNKWTADAYLACCNCDVDVFRTKYDVKVEAGNGTFYNEFRSFPGQESSSSESGLEMLANGKCYNLAAPVSKGTSMTIISDKYKVNSLLGMWDRYGKAYDPASLIVSDKNKWPSQLKDNEAAIESKTILSSTPTFLAPLAGSLYATGQTDLKQESVSFNNIQITEDTEVFFTIVSEYGWNQNLIGYYHYPTANESSVTSSSVTKNIIFADVSKPNNEPFAKGLTGHQDRNNVGTPTDAPIQEFETVKLLYTDADGFTSTVFPKGTTIGFMMMIDPEANAIDPSSTGYNPRTYDLMRWNQWRLFTNTAWNAENTIANGSAANWPSTGYTNSNFFCSGDVCVGSKSSPIPGLAIYGVKDNGINTANTAYGAMIFMVSTKDPAAMQTQNKAYFNIGSGDQVIAK